MTFLSRRAFLGSSAGLASVLVSGHTAPPQSPRPDTVGLGPNTLFPASPDTLFLTWQRDPTTTMTAQWVGPDSLADTSVRWVPRTGDVWRTGVTRTKPFPGTDLKVHRCEMTGLTPGTEYVFQIGLSPPTYRFRTMPAKATDVIQFVSGGDCGTGKHAVATNILAARQEPFFALIGGDLAYDNGTSPGTFLTFLRNYSRHMVDPQGRLVPVLACLGNHEVAGGYTKTRADAGTFLSVFDGLFAENTYGVLDFGDYLSLVLLDTGHVTPIGGEQTGWLESALTERQSRPHLLVANHVPAYPSVRDPGTGTGGTGEGNRLHWCPLFERYGVDGVLEHHDHTFKRTHPLIGGLRDGNGVVYLGDGSWGQIRTPGSISKRPYLAALSRAYHMTVHRLEGHRRYHVALEESGRVADVYASVGKRPAKRA